MLNSAGGESGASESWSWSLTTSSSRMESRLSINQTGTPLERHTPDLTITPCLMIRVPGRGPSIPGAAGSRHLHAHAQHVCKGFKCLVPALLMGSKFFQSLCVPIPHQRTVLVHQLKTQSHIASMFISHFNAQNIGQPGLFQFGRATATITSANSIHVLKRFKFLFRLPTG